jgi:hypothetical protein
MANEASSTGIPQIPPRYEGLADAETFGRLISRPDQIDPHAVAYFAAWIAGLPGGVASVAGGEQTGSAGDVLGAPLIVKVTDRRGHAVARVPVLFQVREVDARVDGRIAIAVLTADDGTASVRWRLGRRAGTQHLEVSAGGKRATFTAEATAPGYSGSTPRLPPSTKSSGPRAS